MKKSIQKSMYQNLCGINCDSLIVNLAKKNFATVLKK